MPGWSIQYLKPSSAARTSTRIPGSQRLSGTRCQTSISPSASKSAQSLRVRMNRRGMPRSDPVTRASSPSGSSACRARHLAEPDRVVRCSSSSVRHCEGPPSGCWRVRHGNDPTRRVRRDGQASSSILTSSVISPVPNMDACSAPSAPSVAKSSYAIPRPRCSVPQPMIESPLGPFGDCVFNTGSLRGGRPVPPRRAGVRR